MQFSGPCVKAREVYIRSRVSAHKFQQKGYSGIIPFVDVGKEEIHKYMQFGV